MNSSTLEASTNTSTPQPYLPNTIADLCVYGINVLFGFSTHSYIIWLIVTGTGSGVASECFNINLSVCELCFSFNCFLIIVSNNSLGSLQTFLNGITISGRPLFQCLMCVERYLAVVRPVTFLKYKPLRYRVICCVIVWIITLGSCCLCCMFIIASLQFHAFIWYFSLQFSLFICVQLCCLVAVLRALKQSGPGERKREKEENHMKRRAFYIILIITVSMVIIFVPFIFAGFFTIFTNMNTGRHRSLGFACFILGGFVHPVLFLHRTGKLSCACSSLSLKL